MAEAQTPEQKIAQLEKDLADARSAVAKGQDLSKSVEELAAQNKALLATLSQKEQEVKIATEKTALETEFKGLIPYDMLIGATIEEKRAHGLKLAEFKGLTIKDGQIVAPKMEKKGDWSQASRTGAPTDVEAAAKAQELAQKEAEAVKNGQTMDVVRLTVGRQVSKLANIFPSLAPAK